MSNGQKRTNDRANRILDAAGELLLRLGYRKVTIEDIAHRADVGKGTVYLHWRSKVLLFQALLLRESIELLDTLMTTLREDPAQVLPHRFLSTSFLITSRRPLLRALFTGDIELLGRLGEGSLRSQQVLVRDEYYATLIRHGLLRDDVPNLAYTVSAAATGFYLVEGIDPEAAELDVQAKADALSHVVHRSFEFDADPDPAVLTAAAAELGTTFEKLTKTYRAFVYAQDPAQPSS